MTGPNDREFRPGVSRRSTIRIIGNDAPALAPASENGAETPQPSARRGMRVVVNGQVVRDGSERSHTPAGPGRSTIRIVNRQDAGQWSQDASLLKSLVQQRNLGRYQDFRREYDRVARQLDRHVCGHAPSRGTFHDWLSGRAPLPHSDFRRQVLETMFPGHTVAQLLSPSGQAPDRTEPVQPSTPEEQLGALLRDFRCAGRVTREALARECLIDPSYVRHAESGRNLPRRQFWAEADIALAADGMLIDAYDRWAAPRNTPRPGVRVLARRQTVPHNDTPHIQPVTKPAEPTPPVTKLADRRRSR
ncbi:helix-turn-helix domain-containing protein [Nocardia terpenica]|uniref:helix-turn-helix domain-containing protein n=1 Tax=Nocardia terpenica TaxID=455432 RepID=UPI002FE3EE6C